MGASYASFSLSWSRDDTTPAPCHAPKSVKSVTYKGAAQNQQTPRARIARRPSLVLETMTPVFVAQTTQACQPRLTAARTRVLGAPGAAHCGPAVAGKQPRRAPLANKARWASSLSLSRPQQLQATFFARQRQARARAPAANNNNGLQVRCDLAPGMINREVLMPTDRMKLDGTSDRGFYDYPRICYHVVRVGVRTNTNAQPTQTVAPYVCGQCNADFGGWWFRVRILWGAA